MSHLQDISRWWTALVSWRSGFGLLHARITEPVQQSGVPAFASSPDAVFVPQYSQSTLLPSLHPAVSAQVDSGGEGDDTDSDSDSEAGDEEDGDSQTPREATHGTVAQHYMKLVCLAAGPPMAASLRDVLQQFEVRVGAGCA